MYQITPGGAYSVLPDFCSSISNAERSGSKQSAAPAESKHPYLHHESSERMPNQTDVTSVTVATSYPA